MAVTWLHVSDFHFKTGDAYDRDVVLRALVKSIRQFYAIGRRPDLIFATGDIAYSGKKAEYTLAEKFFDEVLKATGLNRDRLFVVPGNHDVDRDAGEFLQRTLTTREAADRYFCPKPLQPHFAKLASYKEWYDAYFTGIRSFPTDTTCAPIERIAINGKQLEIVLMNSALFAQGNDDHGQLWLGRRCLDAALPERESVDPAIRIALLHHPVNWLHEVESANIENKLTVHFDVILRGHLHKTDLKSVATESESVLQFAAGAVYQTRKYPNKAMYCTVSDDFVEIFPIRYEDDPEEIWTLDTGVFPKKAPEYTNRFKLPILTSISPPDATTVILTSTPVNSTEPEESAISKHEHINANEIATRLRAQLEKSVARIMDDSTLQNDPFLRMWTKLNPGTPLTEISNFCTTFDPNRILLKIGHTVKEANALADDGFLSPRKPWGPILDLVVNMSLVACARWIKSEPIGQLHLIDELPSVGMYEELAAAIVAATWLNFELIIQVNDPATGKPKIANLIDDFPELQYGNVTLESAIDAEILKKIANELPTVAPKSTHPIHQNHMLAAIREFEDIIGARLVIALSNKQWKPHMNPVLRNNLKQRWNIEIFLFPESEEGVPAENKELWLAIQGHIVDHFNCILGLN